MLAFMKYTSAKLDFLLILDCEFKGSFTADAVRCVALESSCSAMWCVPARYGAAERRTAHVALKLRDNAELHKQILHMRLT